jgi:glycosyltransferase involved in cell wall biosynthesis
MVKAEKMQQSQNKLSFLVFSDDFGVHPSSCQHLFNLVSKEHQVVWINTIGMRNPSISLGDVKKAYRKIGGMLHSSRPGGSDRGNQKITVCQPPMLPYSNFQWVRRVNRFSVVTAVRKLLKTYNLSSTLMVATVPNACEYVRKLGERRAIYYCVDDFSEWPGIEKEVAENMEKSLIAKADAFIATSNKLHARLSEYGKPNYLLTHGVDLELFSSEPENEHHCLRGIPRPRVGYFGLFDQRSDENLIAGVASRMKEWSFVFTGPTAVRPSLLGTLGNVFFTGRVPYGELPSVVKGFDVLCIPYKMNDLTEAISPLKLKEYLATGRPVVSTPIPEVKNWAEYVITASSAEEWEKALRFSLDTSIPERRQALRNVLLNEDWPVKANTFLEICLSISNSRRV